MENKYDKISLNLSFSDKENYDPKAASKGNAFLNFLKLYFRGFLMKIGIHKKLVYSNLSLRWFYSFRDYWAEQLQGRPIFPHDFYFLLCHFRTKYQDLEIGNEKDPDDFLKAWCDDRNVYSLFSYVFKTALQPLTIYKFRKYIKKNAIVCEYGCGIAPISQGLVKYFSHKHLKIHCADIPNVLLHYADWKLKNCDFVKTTKINPSDCSPLQDNYDIIFLLAVLEHLPSPLAVVQHLYQRLKLNGVLIFNYLKSEGTGLDTKAGVEQRSAVLKWIKEHFRVLEGDFDSDGETMVVRKSI